MMSVPSPLGVLDPIWPSPPCPVPLQTAATLCPYWESGHECGDCQVSTGVLNCFWVGHGGDCPYPKLVIPQLVT